MCRRGVRRAWSWGGRRDLVYVSRPGRQLAAAHLRGRECALGVLEVHACAHERARRFAQGSWHGRRQAALAPVVSPSSALAAARKEGLSKVKVATPVEPSRDLVSLTSGMHGSGTPMMNSMYAAGISPNSCASGAACRARALARVWRTPPREKALTCSEARSSVRRSAFAMVDEDRTSKLLRRL